MKPKPIISKEIFRLISEIRYYDETYREEIDTLHRIIKILAKKSEKSAIIELEELLEERSE